MPKTHIMVVEDERIVAKALASCLEGLGHSVSFDCDTGEAALERISLARPDLVLMDIGLNGTLDGVETAIRIWNQFRIPIIFLSGHSDDATLDRAKLAHPVGYLIKPFTDETLQSAVIHAIESRLVKPRIAE